MATRLSKGLASFSFDEGDSDNEESDDEGDADNEESDDEGDADNEESDDEGDADNEEESDMKVMTIEMIMQRMMKLMMMMMMMMTLHLFSCPGYKIPPQLKIPTLLLRKQTS